MPIIKKEISVDAEIEFEAYCTECGAGICNRVDDSDGDGGAYRSPKVSIEPCSCQVDIIQDLEDKIKELQFELDNYSQIN